MTNNTRKSTGVRILFSGDYWPGSNTVYIARAFERCGAIVRFHNQAQIMPQWTSKCGRALRRVLWRPVIEAEWNSQLLALVADFDPDLVYITKGTLIWRRTIQAIAQKSIPIMCFYHDVPWESQDPRFAGAIADFDLVATTREWQKLEFEQAGAKAVSVIRFGYEPSVHYPVALSPRDIKVCGADVTFVGSYHPYRANMLREVVETKFPYTFRLWGNRWEQVPSLRKYWQRRTIEEQELPIVYAASKVALHWVHWEPTGTDCALRKGDQHNSRTFQIAACGGAIMIAQRTDEHLRFFEEDSEAVFFDDASELQNKLSYWLSPSRDGARKSIATAARARCIMEDYSYVPVVRSFLKHFCLPVNDGQAI
jgi:spore maturation protein CgeB